MATRFPRLFLVRTAIGLSQTLPPVENLRGCLARLGVSAGVPARVYFASILEAMSEKQERFGHGEAVAAVSSLFGVVRSVLGEVPEILRVDAACASGGVALGLAMQAIAFEDCPQALALGYEERSATVLAGLKRLQIRSEGPMRPFARRRDGLVPAQGCGAVLLARGPSGPVCLRGYAVTNDAHHPTGPHREGAGLKRCLETCLASAGLEPEDVACLHLNGSGTPYSDASEYQALTAVFGGGLRRLPAYVLKPRLGYLQGAAGVVETAIAARLHARGIVPATPRALLADLEFELGLAAEPRHVTGAHRLVLNTGFGGQSTCLLLERR